MTNTNVLNQLCLARELPLGLRLPFSTLGRHHHDLHPPSWRRGKAASCFLTGDLHVLRERKSPEWHQKRIALHPVYVPLGPRGPACPHLSSFVCFLFGAALGYDITCLNCVPASATTSSSSLLSQPPLRWGPGSARLHHSHWDRSVSSPSAKVPPEQRGCAAQEAQLGVWRRWHPGVASCLLRGGRREGDSCSSFLPQLILRCSGAIILSVLWRLSMHLTGKLRQEEWEVFRERAAASVALLRLEEAILMWLRNWNSLVSWDHRRTGKKKKRFEWQIKAWSWRFKRNPWV